MTDVIAMRDALLFGFFAPLPLAMPLIFALIGTNTSQMVPTALHCVAGDTPPPVVSIVKKLLESLDLRKPGRKSQIFDSRYLISTMIDSGYVFIVVGDATTDAYIAQSMQFLEEVKRAWLTEQNNLRSGAINVREMDWNKFLNTKLAEWSHEENRKQQKIRQLQGEVLDVKNIMKQNMEALIERNEHIDSALYKTGELAAESRVTVTKSTQLKKQLWWNNLKLWGVLLCCVLMLVIVIVALVILIRNSPGSSAPPPLSTTQAPPPDTQTPVPWTTPPPATTVVGTTAPPVLTNTTIPANTTSLSVNTTTPLNSTTVVTPTTAAPSNATSIPPGVSSVAPTTSTPATSPSTIPPVTSATPTTSTPAVSSQQQQAAALRPLPKKPLPSPLRLLFSLLMRREPQT